MYHSQMRPSILFTVTTAIANAAPVRTAAVQINDYLTNAIFNLRVVLLNGGVLSTVRLYGALSATGFPVATPSEALWQYDGAPALAINEGLLRIPMAKRQDGAIAAGACDQVRILPNFLLVEWTNTAPAGDLTFEVWISAVGAVPQGVE